MFVDGVTELSGEHRPQNTPTCPSGTSTLEVGNLGDVPEAGQPRAVCLSPSGEMRQEIIPGGGDWEEGQEILQC